MPNDDGGDDDYDFSAYADKPSAFQETMAMAQFGGASQDEMDALSNSMWDGFYDRSLSPAERALAREDALEAMSFFGVDFDWAEWRSEMGY